MSFMRLINATMNLKHESRHNPTFVPFNLGFSGTCNHITLFSLCSSQVHKVLWMNRAIYTSTEQTQIEGEDCAMQMTVSKKLVNRP